MDCVDMMVIICLCFKQKTAYEMRISDWSSDVCSSDLFTGTVTGYTISDVKYNCFSVSLDHDADMLVRANIGETCVISSQTYQVATASVAAGSSEIGRA